MGCANRSRRSSGPFARPDHIVEDLIEFDIIDHLPAQVAAEFAIGVELLFIEELVGCGLVGEIGICALVRLHSEGDAVNHRCLYINEGACFLGLSLGRGIFDPAQQEAAFRHVGVDRITCAVGHRFLQPSRCQLLRIAARLETDPRPEISSDLATNRIQIGKAEFWVGGGVAQDNQLEPASDQFVQGQILEMPAIAEFDEARVLVMYAERLHYTGNEAVRRKPPAASLRIGYPIPQPKIQ